MQNEIQEERDKAYFYDPLSLYIILTLLSHNKIYLFSHDVALRIQLNKNGKLMWKFMKILWDTQCVILCIQNDEIKIRMS